MNSGEQTSADEFVEKLKRALQKDGDFPASAKIVTELKRLVSDPSTTANQITELILQEPSLGTRILSLVNSSFYRRAKPIMTVSHAVVQIGMKPLAELCAGLVLLQKFVPAARDGGPFASCLQQTITTSILTSSINTKSADVRTSKITETGYLAGTFFELGTLLLAYYFPKVYETAVKRSESKKQELAKSVRELTGLSAAQLSIQVIDALKLPEFYKELILAADQHTPSDAKKIASTPANGGDSSQEVLAQALFAAHTVSESITGGASQDQLDRVLKQLEKSLSIEISTIREALAELPEKFLQHCASLELHLPLLPKFLESYSEAPAPSGGSVQETEDESHNVSDGLELDQFAQFVEEIRESVENREPTASIITSVMETFAWSLHFDRVLLMLVASGKTKLQGRMALGSVQDLDPMTIVRPVGVNAGPYNPDAMAMKESRPVFSGDPVLEDGWPFAVAPIGYGKRVIGVIYADRMDPNARELSSKEQAAIGVLAELLDRSLSLNS